MDLVDILLNLSARGRIRLWLRLRFPDWFTVEEISQGLPILSKQRIQQVLYQSCEKELINRRKRQTNKPGPDPFEYQVPPFLFDNLDKNDLNKLEKL